MAAPAELADDTDTDTGDELCHWLCCDPNVALCGADVTADRWARDEDAVSCVVCIDLVNLPCPRCDFDPGHGRE